VARLVAAGVADRALALGVGPAGAVGDQLAVVADQQSADDLAERAKLRFSGLDQAGADIVPEAEVAAGGFGLAGSGLRTEILVLGARFAEVGVVEPGANEVGVLARRGAVGLGELLVHKVQHEDGVHDPDPRGEVRAPLVNVGVAAVAGAVAGLAGDPDFQRPGLRAGAERVELAVELPGLAAEDADELLSPGLGEVPACPLDLLGAGADRDAELAPPPACRRRWSDSSCGSPCSRRFWWIAPARDPCRAEAGSGGAPPNRPSGAPLSVPVRTAGRRRSPRPRRSPSRRRPAPCRR
jgi:hypothetical protein